MKFGEMLELIRDGSHRAYRTGWNGIRNQLLNESKELEDCNKNLEKELDPIMRGIIGVQIDNFEIQSKQEKIIEEPCMFIYVVIGRIIPYSKVRVPLKAWLNGKDMDIADHIDMKSTDGKIVSGWLASQTDMLAEDWEVVGCRPHEESRNKRLIDIEKIAQILDVDENSIKKESAVTQLLMKVYHKEVLENQGELFDIQVVETLKEKLKDWKILWIDEGNLLRCNIASHMIGGSQIDRGNRYMDLKIKGHDIIITFDKQNEKEVRDKIKNYNIPNKKVFLIEIPYSVDNDGNIRTIILTELSKIVKEI